jgi:hypothetical protein
MVVGRNKKLGGTTCGSSIIRKEARKGGSVRESRLSRRRGRVCVCVTERRVNETVCSERLSGAGRNVNECAGADKKDPREEARFYGEFNHSLFFVLCSKPLL